MASLPDFEAWAIFARVAARGSFARASEELGLSKATVSKAVTRLERRLATPLFHRNTRRLALTEAGKAAADSAERILKAGEAAEAEAVAGSATPRGRVRLAAPMSFGLAHVAPLLPEFFAANPEVSVELHFSDAQVDLIGEGFDVALRIAALADSRLRARRLCAVRRLVVAAPSYLDRAGRPEHPRDLERHACLGYAYPPGQDRWRFLNADGEETWVAVSGPIRVNNADALTPSLLAGLGLAVQPEFIVFDDLAAGRLASVLDDWTPPPIALHVVTPPGAFRPARVTALIDFLSRRLTAAPWAQAAT
ncbi:LysR family transcriptional regulator [Hansschlegelia quercus]|uniref:LysR family transcriptional regulator n=1 Tax=Hansschlegelia quercus TaxID=2528245 RepID=A0A4Q9GLB8_9HYPH|nr:LysR family transcriptional regulator [Hansschlegelia quercus]TBN55199.1 LysR family transcriptional regulator [Hansschlegelia quercus]